jgi:hypothetical protein
MLLRSKFILYLFFSGILILSGLAWVTFSESSYEDCVLNKIQDAKTETAANEIKRICKKKYEWVVVSQKSIVDFKHPLTEIDSFADINLGEHFDSVTYKKGKGVKWEDKDNRGSWWYENETLELEFDIENRVKKIIIPCLNRYTEISLHGVSCGSSEKDLTLRYKLKGRTICHENLPEKRTFIVQEFGIYFPMEKNYVTALIRASEPPIGINCKS